MKLELDFDIGEPEVIVHRAEVRWGNASQFVNVDITDADGLYYVGDNYLPYDEAIARATTLVRASHITQMALRAATAAVEDHLNRGDYL